MNSIYKDRLDGWHVFKGLHFHFLLLLLLLVLPSKKSNYNGDIIRPLRLVSVEWNLMILPRAVPPASRHPQPGLEFLLGIHSSDQHNQEWLFIWSDLTS